MEQETIVVYAAINSDTAVAGTGGYGGRPLKEKKDGKAGLMGL